METRPLLNDVIGSFVEWAIAIMDAIHNGEPYTANGYDQDPYVELMQRPEAITTDPDTREVIVILSKPGDGYRLELVGSLPNPNGLNGIAWCYIRAKGCGTAATYEPNPGDAVWQTLRHWTGTKPCDSD